MPDLQYAIDVAAAMPAGEKTIAQLDALASQLVNAGVSADTLHDAVASVSNSLDAAKAATLSANAALAAGNSEMRALERAAKDAAKARDEAAKTGVVRPEVVAALDAANAAVADHVTTLDRLKASVKAASAEEKHLASTLRNAQQAAAAGAKALQDQEKAARAAEAEAKKLSAEQEKATRTARELTGTEKWFKLQEAMGSTEGKTLLLGKGLALAAGATAALVVAITAVTVAFLAGVAAIAKWAIGLADARRNADLATEAMAAMHPELAGMGGLFKEIGRETGLHADELQGWTGRLKEAGIESGNMAGALRDLALVQAALGDQGANEFLADIKASKGAITGLSNEVRGKLGVIVKKQMIGLSAQSETLKKNVSSIFGGLNIEPFLESLQKLVALFDENTIAGQSLKFLFESIFQPLVDKAAEATVAVEAFALGFLIGATKVYIGVKPVIRAISDLLGFDDPTTAESLDSLTKAGELIAPVILGIAVGFGLMAAAVLALVALALAPLILVVGQVYAAFYVVTGIIDIVTGAFDAVTSYLNGLIPGFGDIGGDIVQGMINGILGGAAGIAGAVVNVAKGAIAAAKATLGIKSPSKVFAELGGYTSEGFALGVDDGAGEAQDAMARLVEPPDVGIPVAALAVGGGGSAADAGAAPGAGERGGRGSPALHIENVYLAGSKATKEDAKSLAEMVTELLEEDAAMLGAEVAT